MLKMDAGRTRRVLVISASFLALLMWSTLRDLPPRTKLDSRVLDEQWWAQPIKERKYRPCEWWRRQAALAEASNGFVVVDCYGGLNQMRRDFCDGVGIARLLNATLVLPQFEGTPYWNDSSGFADIFDADYFIEKMEGYVRVVKELPEELSSRQPFAVDCPKRKLFDYVESVLPLLLEHKVITLRPAASQRSDRYPNWARSSRCQACYGALRLAKHLEETAELIVRALPRPFLALHLRFEPDMIAYSRCVYSNLSRSSLVAIEAARDNKAVFTGDLAVAWRKRGKCPLTPGEAALMLQSLKIPRSMPVYLASGAGLVETDSFTSVYSNTYRKSDVLSPELLRGLHANSKAALDYQVAVRSDVYVATYFGNMDKMVLAMRALDAGGKTLVLDRRAFAEATTEGLEGDELASRLWDVHRASLESDERLPLPDCFCQD